MLTKLFAALMTVILCLGAPLAPSTQVEQAEQFMAPKHHTVIEATAEVPLTAPVLLTAEEVESIVLNRAQLQKQDVRFLPTRIDRDDGRFEWEVQFQYGNWEYECTVDAETGKILDWDKEQAPVKRPVQEPPVTQPTPQPLTGENAQAIALTHAGLTVDQVTRLTVQYDVDDGTPEYEVEFRAGNWEYEYEIHAETGKILSWDKDYDD